MFNRYSLECENCDEDSRNTFWLIDDERRSTDGAILPKIQLREPLDHEEKQVYIFKIVAYDVDGKCINWYNINPTAQLCFLIHQEWTHVFW